MTDMETRLTLVRKIPGTRPVKAIYRCSCGVEREFFRSNVSSGKSRSCGCLNKELAVARMERNKDAFSRGNPRHGMTRTPTHNSWLSMIQRCTNPSRGNYAYYGGRGITIAPEWLEFERFYADMGTRPHGTSLERLDNNAGYGPDNCVWADKRQQARNRRPRGTAHQITT